MIIDKNNQQIIIRTLTFLSLLFALKTKFSQFWVKNIVKKVVEEDNEREMNE